jgi:hypothetical protein
MSTTGSVWIFYNIKTQEKTQPLSKEKAQTYILGLSKAEMRYLVAWTPGWEKWVPVKEILRADQEFFPLPPPIEATDPGLTKTFSGTNSKKSKVRSDLFGTDPFTQTGASKLERTYTEIRLDHVTPNSPDEHNGEFRPEHVNWEKTPIIPILKKNLFMKDSEDERREYKRFPHRIEIVIMTKTGKSFRSSTTNISLGGSLMRDPIPSEILRDAMDIVIVNPFPDEDTPSHLLMKGRIVGDIKDRRRLMFYDVSPEIQFKLQDILLKYKKNYQAHKKKKSA